MDKKAYEHYKKIYRDWESTDWKSTILNLQEKHKEIRTNRHQDLPQEVKSTYIRLRSVVELFQPLSGGLPRPIELARNKAIEKFKIYTGAMNAMDRLTDFYLRVFPGLRSIRSDFDQDNRCNHFEDEIDDDRKQRRERTEDEIIERQTDESDNIRRQQYLNMYFLSRGLEPHPAIAKMTEKKHR